jgi:UDP-N-acetylmuramate dehydrogenase
MEILENIEMKPYSYMEIGGKAKELIFIDNKEELTEYYT